MVCDKMFNNWLFEKKKSPDSKCLPISVMQFQVTKVMALKAELGRDANHGLYELIWTF